VNQILKKVHEYIHEKRDCDDMETRTRKNIHYIPFLFSKRRLKLTCTIFTMLFLRKSFWFSTVNTLFVFITPFPSFHYNMLYYNGITRRSSL
jgi:hypothetical protein